MTGAANSKATAALGKSMPLEENGHSPSGRANGQE